MWFAFGSRAILQMSICGCPITVLGSLFHVPSSGVGTGLVEMAEVVLVEGTDLTRWQLESPQESHSPYVDHPSSLPPGVCVCVWLHTYIQRKVSHMESNFLLMVLALKKAPGALPLSLGLISMITRVPPPPPPAVRQLSFPPEVGRRVYLLTQEVWHSGAGWPQER